MVKNLVNETNAVGLFYEVNNEIHLCTSTNDNPKYKLQVLLHEIGHAIFSRQGINQVPHTLDLQEMVVQNFSTWFVENLDLVNDLLRKFEAQQKKESNVKTKTKKSGPKNRIK